MSDDRIVNLMDADQARYRQDKIGPRLRVFRENDWLNLIDELEFIVGSESPHKLKKDSVKVIEKVLLEADHKEVETGLQLNWEQGESLMQACEDIGARALRDMPHLNLLRDILNSHYLEQRDLDRFSDDL